MTSGSDLLKVADQLFTGELSIVDHHPLAGGGGAAQVADQTLFVSSFANSIAMVAGEHVLVVDTGSQFTARQILDSIRSWSGEQATIVYTHGHVDHVMGAGLWDEEADLNRKPRPEVIAHENVTDRFERYRLTAGYNATINARQFQMSGLHWPVDYRMPDTTFSRTHTVELDSERFELTHAKGETDDHLWLWAPERKVICCGDFFIWASPNCGNPQKAQRYPREWAVALREMATREAEILLPGHGFPVIGGDRVRAVLEDSAALLETIVEQTLKLMNDGAPLDEVLHSVTLPEDLLAKPYLMPIYDEPEFIVRNLWRLYGGWYDGDPSHLKPALSDDIAREIASLAGAAKIAARARTLAESGNLRLASHLIEIAHAARPEDKEITRVRTSIYERRAELEPSTMSKGIFRAAATEGDADGG